MVIVRVFEDLFPRLELLSVLSCLGQLSIVILLVVSLLQWRGKGTKERVHEPTVARAKDSWALLNEGKHLLSQGKREHAVAAYLQAYQEGSPTVRNLAINALDELGEVENF